MDTSGYAVIDGSFGEGGGQIVRTAIVLSVILGRRVEVRNIRAKRDNPGLRPQHLTTIQAAASLCDASVDNLYVGSDCIRFTPGRVRANNLKLDIGSAGSITLLLQTLIVAACIGGVDAEFEIVGGTDVRWSPTIDYFRKVVLPAYRVIGIEAETQVVRRGYYPKGGGLVRASVRPVLELKPFNLVSLPTPSPSIYSVCSNLPKNVAERQSHAAKERLLQNGITPQESSVTVEDSVSPGTAILVSSVGDHGPFVGGDAIGERGKRAELIGREAADRYLDNCRLEAPVDSHLSDMLVVPLALVNSESKFRVNRISKHLTTNIHVIKQLVKCDFQIEELSDRTVIIYIRPPSSRMYA